MPNFERQAGADKGEVERLYRNDKSKRQFNREYVSTEDVPENVDLHNTGEQASAEENIEKNVDGGREDGKKLDFENINAETNPELLVACNDYMNERGELPSGLTHEEARELAIRFKETLGEDDLQTSVKKEKGRGSRSKATNLEGDMVARATPEAGEPTQVDRSDQQRHSIQKLINKKPAA